MAPTPAPRELILVAEPGAGLRAAEEGLFSMFGTSLDPLTDLLSSAGASLQPLFGLSEDLLERRASLVADKWEAAPLHLSLFYKVSAADSKLEILAEQLRDNAAVHAAYIKPGAELPIVDSGMTLPLGPNPAERTPALVDRQIYLGDAPEGLDAFSAWKVAGGGGAGTNIIDIEGAWRFTHEDLKENQGGVVGGIEIADLEWRNHGTAVLGILSGDRNDFGITGICPEASVRAVSVYGQPGGYFPQDSGTAAAIRQAADMLKSGDIIVLEMSTPGPLSEFKLREDQQGYIPVEWWPDNLAAIQYAVRRGVIVIEAAANGGSNLDDQVYDVNPSPPYGPFPKNWSNPFRRNKIDTGSIVVGAGAPPLGINGSNWGPDRSRLDFTNFGSWIDAQGWGREVTTCAYGDLQRGLDEDLWYTKVFNGTSSATPMVAGALACVQGVLRQAGKALLTPAIARELLRATGSRQEDAPGMPASQRIGNRPDLYELINKLSFQ